MIPNGSLNKKGRLVLKLDSKISLPSIIKKSSLSEICHAICENNKKSEEIEDVNSILITLFQNCPERIELDSMKDVLAKNNFAELHLDKGRKTDYRYFNEEGKLTDYVDFRLYSRTNLKGNFKKTIEELINKNPDLSEVLKHHKDAQGSQHVTIINYELLLTLRDKPVLESNLLQVQSEIMALQEKKKQIKADLKAKRTSEIDLGNRVIAQLDVRIGEINKKMIDVKEKMQSLSIQELFNHPVDSEQLQNLMNTQKELQTGLDALREQKFNLNLSLTTKKRRYFDRTGSDFFNTKKSRKDASPQPSTETSISSQCT